MKLTKEQFLGYVDHSLLKPNLTLDEIRRGCEFAAEVGAKAVCISPHRLGIAREILSGTPVIIGTVAAFPSGAHMTEVKAFEARRCVEAGASEVDMVIDVGALLSGRDDMVRDDIRAVVEAADPAHVKVILETHYLTDEQIVRGAQLVSEAGAAFVKTATGFTPTGATPHNVALLRQGAAPLTKVKAAGGISTLADVIAVIEAGADRIGISRTQAILDEIEAQS
ncbi:deoxyribose-phosphate aldolase [Propionicicella superfundia]|uniref:deoxyribose-phosphate aldolase n=1 Tax=Propionicicella superfundia TaxID=348582 RepID=UPI000422692B|nr:deoxyribose-phosphate aldolase [Propionicicella superfundia]